MKAFSSAILLLAFSTAVDAFGESMPWIEDFAGLNDGDVKDEGVTSWTATRSNGIFHIDSEKLLINKGGATDIGYLESGWIDVGSSSRILFSASFEEASGNNLDADDYIDFKVLLPDGTSIQIGHITDDFNDITMSQEVDVVDFDSVKLDIQAKVDHNNEKIWFTRLEVSEVAAATPEVPPSGGLSDADACTVKLLGNKYKPFDEGSGYCPSGQECSFFLDTETDTLPETITGTCEDSACKKDNKKPTPGSHRVTICHRTCSEANPWVRITMDKSAWADEEFCGHGVQHDIRVECSGKAPWDAWGGKFTDYLIKDHGIKQDLVCGANPTTDPTDPCYPFADEKAYWKHWEHACPYVRNGACCNGDECCGDLTGTTGGGGDPHIKRWNRKTFPFHGECDLVMVHSDEFHNGAGFDLHLRTTIQNWFSYVEAMAMRVGDYVVEMHSEYLYVDGVEYKDEDLPVTFGGDFKYTIGAPTLNEDVKHDGARTYKIYKIDLHKDSYVDVKIYNEMLFVSVSGHHNDFNDATGLSGDYYLGKMHNREGERIYWDTDMYSFHWQVQPNTDGQLFQTARSPQYPQQCNMPTEQRTSRRLRASNTALFEQAKKACVSATEAEACIDDIIVTGDMTLAELW